MRKIRYACIILALCMLLPILAACDAPAVRPPETEPDYSPLDGSNIQFLTAREFSSTREKGSVSDDFRKASANFAFELLGQSRTYAEGNGLLVSPLSVMLALAMTANGAEGETLLQMEKVLADGMTVDKLNAELFNYTSALVSTDDAKFNLANAIWVSSDPSFSVNENFIKEIENTYDADIVAANMGDISTLDAINQWVDEETFGMIKNIFDNPLDPSTVMVLLNALAFDAIWEDQPLDSSCHKAVFNGTQKAAQTDFMWASCDGYIEDNGITGIVKNYNGGNYAFVAIMPDRTTDIKDYLKRLDGDTFLELFDMRQKASEKVNVTARIPFFSFDCTVGLNDILKSMGMPRAFDSTNAEFANFGLSSVGNIYISQVLHKTHIDLDNSGTRAAAVTAVIETPNSAEPTDTRNFLIELDRPFVYAIVDTATGLPIFLGTCENIG